jgi:hypothetical protein
MLSPQAAAETGLVGAPSVAHQQHVRDRQLAGVGEGEQRSRGAGATPGASYAPETPCKSRRTPSHPDPRYGDDARSRADTPERLGAKR